MGNNTKVTSRLCAAGVLSALVLSICGCASEDKKASSTTRAQTEAAPATTAAATAATAPAAAGSAAVALTSDGNTPSASAPNVALATASPFGSALAITAGVTVQAKDVRKAVLALPDIVTAKGGAIFDSDIAVGNPETATATITIKVPPTDLESLIDGIGGVGDLVGRTQKTEDVSAQITDVDARIQTAQASVDRVRELLKTATNIDDVVRLESEVTTRETTLEELLASQRNLGDRVQLATLTVTIQPVPAAQLIAKPPVRKHTSVGGAFHKGWRAFTNAAHGIAVAFGYTAPFLAIMLLIGLVAAVLRRRFGRLLSRPHAPVPSSPSPVS